MAQTMHIVTYRRLREFGDRYADARAPLAAWYRIMRAKRYANPNELKVDFPRASILGGGVTVFDIGGNKYRLVVAMRYHKGMVFVRHVVTHQHYDEAPKAGTL